MWVLDLGIFLCEFQIWALDNVVLAMLVDGVVDQVGLEFVRWGWTLQHPILHKIN